MTSLLIWCPAPCRAVTTHSCGSGFIRCQVCRTSRPNDIPFLISQLASTTYCGMCRASMPVGHVCMAGKVGCTIRLADEPACGGCHGCQQAGLDAYQLIQQDARRLDHPA